MSKNYAQTAKDAEAFLQSIKKFNERDNNAAEQYSSSPTIDSNSGPSGDNHDRSDLNKATPKFSFATLEFSPHSQYSNPLRADLLTFLEVHYYNKKKLPTIADLNKHFANHPEAPKNNNGWLPLLDSISDSLLNRGIQPYNTVENYIDPKFAWAVSLIVNTLDKRTIPAKLKEAGLSTKEWTAYLRRKRYYEYFQSRLDEIFDQDVRNEAKLALSRLVSSGDLAAIKYYNELTNIYRPDTTSPNQMIAVVLTAVMEILATHVSSEILSKIATEIRSSPSVTKVIKAIDTESR